MFGFKFSSESKRMLHTSLLHRICFSFPQLSPKPTKEDKTQKSNALVQFFALNYLYSKPKIVYGYN